MIGQYGLALSTFSLASAGWLLFAAAPATAQRVTGQWDFNSPASGLRATVGRDGSFWTRPGGSRDIAQETQFGTPASLGIAGFPGGGSGGVMRFPNCDRFMGYAMFPQIDANGGGEYVNEFTIIYDMLWPASSQGTWRSFLQTNECTNNDGDLFVNPANGIGISGTYTGTVLGNTWQRIAFTFDLANSTLNKYIDGALVGTQTLADGVDGRWALFTTTHNLPTLLFTDDDGDTNVGYVSSVQIRNYTMSGAEIAALGGVTAANVSPTIDPTAPPGAAVAGQWNFENPNDGLHATIGRDLEWFRGCACTDNLPGQTQFGTSGTDFPQVPNLPDGPAGVMYFGAPEPCSAYLFPHGAEANGGGQRVNDYTVIMDLYYPIDDYFGMTAPTHTADWCALYQSSPNNSEDAMLWIRTLDGALGDDGEYAGTEFWCLEESWFRIVAMVHGSPAGTTATKYVLYPNDTHVGPVAVTFAGELVDGKRSLVTNESTWHEDIFFAFADDDAETHRGFVNSLQIRDYVMNEAEIIALGGPRAAGIPRPASCPGDLNGDHSVGLSDMTILLSHFGTPSGAGPGDGDMNGDGDVDLSDLTAFLSNFGTMCS